MGSQLLRSNCHRFIRLGIDSDANASDLKMCFGLTDTRGRRYPELLNLKYSVIYHPNKQECGLSSPES